MSPNDRTETAMPMTVYKSVLRAKIAWDGSSPALINRYPQYRPITTDVTATNHENQLSRPIMVLTMFVRVTAYPCVLFL